jgi:hypothetical protein
MEGKDAYGNLRKLDDETEQRLTVAKQFGGERKGKFSSMLRAKFLSEIEIELANSNYNNSSTSHHKRGAGDAEEEFNEPVLPAPFVAHLSPVERQSLARSGASDAEATRAQAALLLKWREIITSERDNNMSGSRLEKGHVQRVQFFLIMQCHYLPHVVPCWLEAARHAETAFTHERHRDRVQRVREIFDTALLFHPSSSLLLIAYAEFLMRERVDDHRAASELLASRAKRLALKIADDASGSAVDELVVLYVNWMRWARSYGDVAEAAGLVRLVAKHAIVDVGLLANIIAAVKKFIKDGARNNQRAVVSSSSPSPSSHSRPLSLPPSDFSPVRHLRAFNIFCSEWLCMETLALRAPDAALAVLQAWTSHLTRMLLTTKSQEWTLRMCGVDELLISSCRLLCITYPSLCPAVLEQLNAITSCEVFAPFRRRCAAVEANWIRELVQLVDPCHAICRALQLTSLLDMMTIGVGSEPDDLIADWASGEACLANPVVDHRLEGLPQGLLPHYGSQPMSSCRKACAELLPDLGVLSDAMAAAATHEQRVTETPHRLISPADIVRPIASMWAKMAGLPENPNQRRPPSSGGRGPRRAAFLRPPGGAAVQPNQQQQLDATSTTALPPGDAFDGGDSDGEHDENDEAAAAAGEAPPLLQQGRGRRRQLERLSRTIFAEAKAPQRRSLVNCIDRMYCEHLTERALREGAEERARKRIRVESGAVSPPPSSQTAADGSSTVEARRQQFLAAAGKQRLIMGRRDYERDQSLEALASVLRALPSEGSLASLLMVAPGNSYDDNHAPLLPVPGAGLDVSTRYLVSALWESPSLLALIGGSKPTSSER